MADTQRETSARAQVMLNFWGNMLQGLMGMMTDMDDKRECAHLYNDVVKNNSNITMIELNARTAQRLRGALKKAHVDSAMMVDGRNGNPIILVDVRNLDAVRNAMKSINKSEPKNVAEMAYIEKLKGKLPVMERFTGNFTHEEAVKVLETAKANNCPCVIEPNKNGSYDIICEQDKATHVSKFISDSLWQMQGTYGDIHNGELTHKINMDEKIQDAIANSDAGKACFIVSGQDPTQYLYMNSEKLYKHTGYVTTDKTEYRKGNKDFDVIADWYADNIQNPVVLTEEQVQELGGPESDKFKEKVSELKYSVTRDIGDCEKANQERQMKIWMNTNFRHADIADYLNMTKGVTENIVADFKDEYMEKAKNKQLSEAAFGVTKNDIMKIAENLSKRAESITHETLFFDKNRSLEDEIKDAYQVAGKPYVPVKEQPDKAQPQQ